MQILVVCKYGKNRNVYLKNYLESRGYQAQARGLASADLQEKIDESDIIVSVHPDILHELQVITDVSKKKIISLNTEDRPQFVLTNKKQLDGNEWLAFQKEYVYAKLIEQMEKHLPL